MFFILLLRSSRYVATGCTFGRAAFFDLNTGDFLVVQAHAMQIKRVHFIAFASDDAYAVSAAADGARFWNHLTGAAYCTGDWHLPSIVTVSGACLRSFRMSASVSSAFLTTKRLYLGHYEQEDPDELGGKSCCAIWNLNMPSMYVCLGCILTHTANNCRCF